MSAFQEILRRAVEATPGAIGGAFAARDGETVDSVSAWERTEWALLTAHYGVVLNHVQSALNTFHFGEADELVVRHEELDIVLYAVAEGYFALMALRHPCSLGLAMRQLVRASSELRREMA